MFFYVYFLEFCNFEFQNDYGCRKFNIDYMNLINNYGPPKIFKSKCSNKRYVTNLACNLSLYITEGWTRSPEGEGQLLGD